MVSHINYHLNAHEDFVIFLTSKLNHLLFFHDATLGMESQSFTYLLRGSENIY